MKKIGVFTETKWKQTYKKRQNENRRINRDKVKTGVLRETKWKQAYSQRQNENRRIKRDKMKIDV